MGDVSLHGLIVLDPLVHIFPVNRRLFRGSDSNSDLLPSLAENDDLYIVTNAGGFS